MKLTPELFTAPNVIIQGITGRQGQFHAARMKAYGTHVVGGTSPSKSGEAIDGIPVFASIKDIQATTQVDASVIFVPSAHAKSAIIEAIDAEVSLIVCITEHIPVHDMLYISQYIQHKRSVLIGPNCPGVLIPGTHLLGIVPAALSTPGDTAIVSRSGTLTYEAMDALTHRGFGQHYVIGIGGDIIHGAGYTDCLELFEHDPGVARVVMIGEIGGTDEIAAADYIRTMSKPVYAYVAGHHAPAGVQMGHAGAILGTNRLESAAIKTSLLAEAGATVSGSLVDLIDNVV